MKCSRHELFQGQRASGLRYAEERVQLLLIAVTIFHLLPHGFRNRDLREYLARLLGRPPEAITQGRMTYDLRRLRLFTGSSNEFRAPIDTP